MTIYKMFRDYKVYIHVRYKMKDLDTTFVSQQVNCRLPVNQTSLCSVWPTVLGAPPLKCRIVGTMLEYPSEGHRDVGCSFFCSSVSVGDVSITPR